MADSENGVRNWQSVRTVLEALILAAVLWSAKVQTTLQAQVAVLQDNVLQLRTQLSDVPSLNRQIAEIKIRVDRHDEDLQELRQVKRLR